MNVFNGKKNFSCEKPQLEHVVWNYYYTNTTEEFKQQEERILLLCYLGMSFFIVLLFISTAWAFQLHCMTLQWTPEWSPLQGQEMSEKHFSLIWVGKEINALTYSEDACWPVWPLSHWLYLCQCNVLWILGICVWVANREIRVPLNPRKNMSEKYVQKVKIFCLIAIIYGLCQWVTTPIRM